MTIQIQMPNYQSCLFSFVIAREARQSPAFTTEIASSPKAPRKDKEGAEIAEPVPKRSEESRGSSQRQGEGMSLRAPIYRGVAI